MLEGMNANVRLADNGKLALEAYQEQIPDLVIMDISMPEMDGHEATKLIREWEAQEGITKTPILAATAHVMEEDHKKALAVGMDDVITKPIKQQILQAAISKWSEIPAASTHKRDAS